MVGAPLGMADDHVDAAGILEHLGQGGDSYDLHVSVENHALAGGNDGTIDVTGSSTITYTGLEPISSAITATDVTLNYSTAAETITVSDSGTAGRTRVDSTAGEGVTFDNPTGSLTIDGGTTGSDTMVVTGLGSGDVF